MNTSMRKSTRSALRCLAAALLLAAMSLQQVALAQSTRTACPLGDRFCQLQPRFSFGSAVVNNKAYYHGGLDAKNETRPWADDVLEVVDLTTLEAFALPFPASNPEYMTRRYRHLMAPFRNGLVMAGGQVDDKNGLSVNTLNVLGMDVDARQYMVLRTFQQPGGKADAVFSTVEVKRDAMSFVSTTMPYDVPMESQRALRVLNLTTDKLSDGIISFKGTNLEFLNFPLVTHHSLLLDGLPPYLLLEARRDVTPDIFESIAQENGSFVAALVDPYAQEGSGGDRKGPMPITWNLPKVLAAGARGSATAEYASGKTLAMQLMPGTAELELQLVLWTLSSSIWACDSKCPPGITSGRTRVPASVVSIWSLQLAGTLEKPELQATPLHLVVGVPLGLQLEQLAVVHAPFLNAVRVTPGLLASGLLSSMPYVGEVDLNKNSDTSNVALTATDGGFVVRGTASAPVNCPLWQSGKQTFILNFTLGTPVSPIVTGGSLYTSGCMDGNVEAGGDIKSITDAQTQCGAGIGMYGVTTGDGTFKCMTWDAPCHQVFYEFWEYDNSTSQGYGVLMDPATRELQSLRVQVPKGYPYATSRTACVLNTPGAASLYVEYGGQPLATKGNPKQTPVSDMYAMRLGTPASGVWQMSRVAGDALPKLAAAAMACGPDNTVYIFGGMEDRGRGDQSTLVPTTALVKVKVNAAGVASYGLTATALRPSGRGPAARSNHVLIYLEPSLVQKWGMRQGALLLHGGSNLDNTRFTETRATESTPWQKGFQMYDDTWLFDLGINSWRQLTGVTTPVPLMWHSGSVYVNADTMAKEVVLFGGTTYDKLNGTLDQSVNVMQLDLTASQPAWRAIPVNITGGKDALKTKYPNSGVCTTPGAAAYLLRQHKVVTATISPHTWELSGTSEEVIRDWQAKAINMGMGDVVKVSVEGGRLELDAPLVVPGITVVPGDFDRPAARAVNGAAAKQPRGAAAQPAATSSAAGSTGARRLQQLGDAAAATAPAAEAEVGAGAGATGPQPAAGQPLRKVLQVVCRNTSAFLVTASGSTLQDVSISGCVGTSVEVTSSAAGAAPVTLRRVTITNSTGDKGAAVTIAPDAEVVLEGCVITRNNASGVGSAVFADEGSRLQLLKDTYITSNNGTGVYFLGERLTARGASIAGNAADGVGGGIYAEAARGGLSRTLVVLTSSIVAGNRAGVAGGGIALGRGARLSLLDSSVYNNAAAVGGAVAGLSGSCLVSARRVTFTGNNATQTGGAINLQGSLCDGEQVQLSRVQFTNNLAGSNGGGMSVLDASAMLLNISDSNFTSNHAENQGSGSSGMGGGLYAVMWTSQVNITRSLFANNTATASGAGMHLFGVSTNLTVVNASFTANVAGVPGDATVAGAMVAAAMLMPTRGGGAHVTGASVNGLVENSTFAVNGASLGAGLSFAPDAGRLVVSKGTRFRFNAAASQGGGLLVGAGAALLVTNTSFTNNTARAAQGAGGGLCCLRCVAPLLQGSRFSGNAAAFGGGAALLQPSGPSAVVGCRFFNNTALVAAATTLPTAASMAASGSIAAEFLTTDGLFWPLSGKQSGGRALAKLPVAANATFDSGAYSGGGGLYVSPQAAFNLSGSSFEQNRALSGGGLLGRTDFCPDSGNCMRMSTDNTFSGNTAVKGAGGALLVTNAALVQCGGSEGQQSLQNCVGGTALRRRRLQQQQLVGGEELDPFTQQRADNLAQGGGYGDELATAASQIILRRKTDPPYCINNSTNTSSSSNGSGAGTARPPSKIRVAPGGLGVQVSLHLKDALGQCVSGDISDASMWLQGRLRFTNNTLASRMTLLGNSVRADNGSATFTALQVYAYPGDYLLELHSPSSTLLAPQLLPLEVRYCVAGEATQVAENNQYSKVQCIPCNAGTYSFDPARNSCLSCDWTDHAECDGAAKVPLPGFYQSHPRNPQIHACLWAGSCIRTNRSITAMKDWANDPDLTWMTGEQLNQVDLSPYMDTMCTPGYTGPLCGACTPDHGRVGFQCSQCFKHKVGHYLLYILMWIYLFGMVLVAGWIHVREVMQRHRKREAAATLQLLKPHMLGSVASQPTEFRVHARKRHEDEDPKPPAPQHAGKGGKDAGMAMVMGGNTPLYKPGGRSKTTDSAFSSQLSPSSAAPCSAPGSAGTAVPSSSSNSSNSGFALGSPSAQPRSGGSTSSSSSGGRAVSSGVVPPLGSGPRTLPATVEEASEEAFVTAPESDMAAIDLWGAAAPLANASSHGTGMSGPSSDAEAIGMWGPAFGSDVIVANSSLGSRKPNGTVKANGSARPLGEGKEEGLGEATYMEQPSSDAAAYDAWASAAVEAAPAAGGQGTATLATVDSDAGMADVYGAAAGQLGSLSPQQQQQQQGGGLGGGGWGSGAAGATSAAAAAAAAAHSSSSNTRSGSRWASSQRSGIPTSLGAANWESYDEAGRVAAGSGDPVAWSGSAAGGARSNGPASSRFGGQYVVAAGGVQGSSATHVSDAPQLSDSSLVGPLTTGHNSVVEDTKPQRDMSGPPRLLEGAPALPGAASGDHRGSLSSQPIKRGSKIWKRLLGTEDLDEEDRLKIVSKASRSLSEDGMARPAVEASTVMVDRSQKFYISDIVKLGITHLQMLGIMRLMGLSWPAEAETMLTYADQTLPVVGWLNLDCIVPDSALLPRPLARAAVQLLVPLGALGLVVLFWVLMRWINRRRGFMYSDKQFYRPRLVLSVILVLFYLYPSVTNVVVGLFACTDVDSMDPPNDNNTPLPGVVLQLASYWTGETSIQCWRGPHLWMVIFVALPYLVLFSVGFPLVLVWRLYRRRYQLGCQSMELRYGFLYESYHVRYYFWESVVLVEKLALILPVMLLQRKGQGLQVLVAMLVVTSASILQITFQPFACKMLDTLQRASFHVLQITLFLLMISALAGAGGIINLSYDTSQKFTLNILPVIGAINGMLLCLFVLCVYLECRRFALHVLGRGKDDALSWGDVWGLIKGMLFSWRKSEEGTAASAAGKLPVQQPQTVVDDPLLHNAGLRGPSKV